jgi:predicted nuclease of predicted toxin-antitoxin system
MASWIKVTFQIDAMALRDIGLRDATDEDIFAAGRKAHAIVMTKDADFVRLVEERGSPPQVLWITCGNTSNERLREILSGALIRALELFRLDEKLVEIGSRQLIQ